MRQRGQTVILLGLLAVAAPAPSVRCAIAAPVTAGSLPALRERKAERILDEFRARGTPHPSSTAEAGDDAVSAASGAAGRTRGASPARIAAIPVNVIHNNRTGDLPNITQSENAVAMDGVYGIASWNDGIGGASGMQGLAYTTNGGASWTDIGSLPVNGSVTGWTGSPVCAVNPTTHEFSVIGFGTAQQQIAICKVTFPGGVFTITGPTVVHQRSGTDLLDRPWLSVDPASGALFVTWTNFVAGSTSRIELTRSIDGGISWDPPLVVNAPAANGRVQGARSQVGPAGEVCVVWYEVGLADLDFVKIRKSTNLGVSFGAEATAVSFFTNFGSGAPGFNRLHSVDYPSIGIDNSTGPHRGRIYVAVNESVDWFDDPLGGLGDRAEVESNNTIATATPFTAGERLHGTLAVGSASPDYWSFNATQGTTYIFVADSVATMFYTMRVFCADGVTSLAQTGDNTACPGSPSSMVWTAPATAPYTIRMSSVSGNVTGCPTNSSGGYRIQTGINANPGAGGEVARDHRDIFVAWSDNAVTWTKTRVNDGPPYLDDFLPEVQVASDGYPYVLWYDWRDGACGGSSATYLARSTTGGTSFSANQRVASALTNWTTALGNMTPNFGEHIGLFASGRFDGIAMAWGDGRLGDIDQFGAGTACQQTLSDCPGDVAVVAPQNGVRALNLSLTVENPNVLFDNSYVLALTNSRGWSMVVPGGVDVAAGSGETVSFTLNVPDTAAAGVAQARLIVTLDGAAHAETCLVRIAVDRPVATLVAVVAAAADGGVANLEWQVNVPGTVTIERTRTGAVWDRLAAVTPDRAGRVRYRDANVVAGTRTGYRLRVMTPDGERTAGEVWVDVPVSPRFALRIANPITGGVPTVSVSLPSAGPASLEFLDARGRRLHRQELGSLAAGTHVFSFPQLQGRLGEGVLLVRLSHAGRSITRKVAVIR
jgi:hypothetical protein